MKGKAVLILFAALVLIQMCIVLIIAAEFVVPNSADFQRLLVDIGRLPNNSQEIRNAVFEGRWNGICGQSLAQNVLLIDVLMLLILAVAIVRRRKDGRES